MGQNLFKSFVFEMSMEEAKKILAENSKILKNIPFGEETLYAVRKKSLVRKDGKLISIILGSKTNLNLKQAETYLKKSRAYFESEKFTMVYAHGFM